MTTPLTHQERAHRAARLIDGNPGAYQEMLVNRIAREMYPGDLVSKARMALRCNFMGTGICPRCREELHRVLALYPEEPES